MTSLTLALLLFVSVVATAVVSGTFGMAGGMILMGIYATALPVAGAMVLHGVTQLASNGTRAWISRRYVDRRVLGGFAIGALLALGLFWGLAVQVDRAVLFVVLGATPLAPRLLLADRCLHVETGPMRVLCGLVVTATQLLCGVSGPLLDVFFLRSRLDRRQVVATKALVQSLGHTLKLVYFGGILPASSDVALELPLWVYPLVIVSAALGTWLGRRVLDRLSDRQFYAATTWIVSGIGVVYLVRGLLGLASVPG